MTGTLPALVATHGILLVGAAAYLSCLIVPIPTSLLMVATGGFVAAGDLAALPAVLSIWGAAVLGDQTGYWIGRCRGPQVLARIGRRPARAAALARARAALDTHGPRAMFLAAWAFAPLCPYVNLAAGAGGLDWWRYTRAGTSGEAVWVGGYMAIGYLFADRFAALSRTLPGLSGLLIGGLLLVLAGFALLRLLRRKGRAGALARSGRRSRV